MKWKPRPAARWNVAGRQIGRMDFKSRLVCSLSESVDAGAYLDSANYSRLGVRRKLCNFAPAATIGVGTSLVITQRHRFVRVPANLLEALFRARLSAVPLRIVIWVIRQTYGWNRLWAPFTWYGLAKDLSSNRGTVFRAGARLFRGRALRSAAGQLGIHPELTSWNSAPSTADAVAREQRWTTHSRATKKQRKPLPGGNATVAQEQRFSVERKTGVKTQRQRRRGRGYVDNLQATDNEAVQQLVNFYGALTGKALLPDEAARFSHSAKALLDACGNLPDAKKLLAQSLAKPET